MIVSPELEQRILRGDGQTAPPLQRSPGRVAEPLREISEKDFMAAVIALAKRNGWLIYHTRDSRKSERGFPDVVMLRLNRLLVAELKSETGRLTAPQATWIEAFEQAGIDARVWRPSDWPEIEAALQ